MSLSVGHEPLPKRAGLSPRKRRLRVTLGVLAACVVLAAAAGVLLYLRARPAQYRPDETSEDITSSLARSLPSDAPRPKFTDVTRQAGLADFRTFAGTRTSQLPEDMGAGLAWGDFNNDGLDDLLVVSAGGALNLPEEQLLPCVLYQNLGNGTFRKVEAFPELRIHGMAAAWGDYDGDGFLDLVLTGYNALVLLHNEGGTGKFTRDPRLPNLKGFWSGAAWGDYDNDRRLDLYVCNYVQYAANEADRGKLSQQIGTAVPYTLNPSSYEPGLNALFHQLPDGSFVDVAAEMRVQNPEGRSLGGLWHDFDNDGWLDLYIANDVSDNVFYHNIGGRFEDISHPAWVADYRSAMGLAVGDFDRDGDDDLHISHWVAQENALYENLLVNRNARTNANASGVAGSNAPPLRFVDIADAKGLGQVALPYVGWGTEFVDLDQDGWPDLLVANGSTLEMDGPAPRKLQPQELFVFWNRRGECFHNLAPLNPALSEKHVSRGLACADFDNDGDMDFAVADLGEGVRLFRNDMATGHWLKVRLRSKNAAGNATGFGVGSTVIAWVGGEQLRRSVTGVSYLSQSSHTLHWGLGAAAKVDGLEIRWHAGETNTIEGLEANAMYEIFEGENMAHRFASTTSPLSASVVSPAAPAAPSAGSGTADKQRLVQFWTIQRAAMNALKIENDNAKAIRLFRDALELNPAHEDSRYYLGLCLATQGEVQEALTALSELQKLNPQSHRAWQQWGIVRASTATSDAELAQAEQALQTAHQLNPEETGALMALGEVALLRHNPDLAEQRLRDATRTNPKAAGGFFLCGYLSWKRGDIEAATHYLDHARKALGPDWQPKGATSEGDVKRKQHLDSSPLHSFWESWNGLPEPAAAFAALDQRLSKGFATP
jgi:tetratricopeptide (TPR) repeat protein